MLEYNLFGETVISACIRSRTHHIDLSAELKNLETIQAKYFNAAREKGIYIIQACGFGSIPGDYGVALLTKNFPGDLNSVEYYVQTKHGPEGAKVHIGTFVSVMGSLRDYLHMKKYKRLLKDNVFSKDKIRSKYQLSRRWPVFYSKDIESFCVWFLGPEERIVRRSQMFRYEYLNERPVQCYPYVKTPSLKSVIKTIIFGAICAILAFFSFGLRLLSKYPSVFTVGTFTTTGPTREQVEQSSTKFTLIGKGWKTKLGNLEEEHDEKPDTKMKLTITGPEPGYALTSMCMVHAGLTVLEEIDKLPLDGGVLTPGAAFENTTLSERLRKRGVVFTFEHIH